MKRGAPPPVFLMGPTAAGKTRLAMELTGCFPCTIVSVDSVMVYRGLDIGSGKPDAAQLARAPHRLIDIRDPTEPYSAAEFRRDALREIAAIQAQGRIPLLVGGTGLYFRALQRGLTALPGADPALRARLESEARAAGWATLHARLARVDPQAARRIHPHDPQRIQRALEVWELTGRRLSALWVEQAGAPPLAARKIILEPCDRSRLHHRIANRFDRMLSQGLVAEVAALRGRPGIHAGLPAMRAVGYRQVWEYLAGECDLNSMVSRAVTATGVSRGASSPGCGASKVRSDSIARRRISMSRCGMCWRRAEAPVDDLGLELMS